MNLLETIKNILNRIRGAFPSALPQGLPEYDAWIKSFINTYKPKMEERSVRFVVATLMMRLNPTEAYKSKRYFALCLHKGAAAEVSGYVMRLCKEEQEKEAAAEREKLEATKSIDKVESNEQQPVQN